VKLDRVGFIDCSGPFYRRQATKIEVEVVKSASLRSLCVVRLIM
jgi:hypothetical protein